MIKKVITIILICMFLFILVPNSTGNLVKQTDTFDVTISVFAMNDLAVTYKIDPQHTWVKVKQLYPKESGWEYLTCQQSEPAKKLTFTFTLSTTGSSYTYNITAGSDNRFNDAEITNILISPNNPGANIILGKKSRSMNYLNLQILKMIPNFSNLLKCYSSKY